MAGVNDLTGSTLIAGPNVKKLAAALFTLILTASAPAYAAQVVSSSTGAVSSLVAKTTRSALNGVFATATATGYLLVLDATADPGNGAIAAGTLLSLLSHADD